MEYRKARYKYNSRYKNNHYNYTSVAHNYAPEYDYIPKKRNRPIKKIQKERYVKAEQGLKIFSLKFFVALVIVSTFIVGVVFIEALTIQRKFEIESLTATLKEINENNKNLETELAKNLDLDYVESKAILNFGMQKPASHQIVHINVPKESYSEKNNIQKEVSIWEKLTNLFTN